MKSGNALFCSLVLTVTSLSLAAAAAQASSDPSFTRSDVCKLPQVSGPCEAYMPRWFHNPETEQCERFIYGGCQGNGNNFRTQEDCQVACPTQKIPCAGFVGLGCPGNLVCLDDPSDDCDPALGGADCMGLCVPGPAPVKSYCMSSASCQPNEYCTTEDDVCLKNPRMPMLTVCWGTCAARAVEDKACFASGCSGQICADRSVISTCEWRPEYACYRSASCQTQANGRCGWTLTADLAACLGLR